MRARAQLLSKSFLVHLFGKLCYHDISCVTGKVRTRLVLSCLESQVDLRPHGSSTKSTAICFEPSEEMSKDVSSLAKTSTLIFRADASEIVMAPELKVGFVVLANTVEHAQVIKFNEVMT